MANAESAGREKQRRIIFVFFFLSGLISATWSSRLPDVQQKLHVNNAAFGTVLASLYAGLFVGLAIASWLVASHGARKIMLITCIASAGLLVLAGLAYSVFSVMSILFLMGFARTIFNLSANTGAIEVQGFYPRPILAGFHGVWSIACFFAGGIGTVMIIAGWSPFWHFALISVTVLLALLLLNERPVRLLRGNEPRPFFVRPDRYLFLLGLMALGVMMCEGAMFDWGVHYFEHVVRVKRSLITTGYLSFIIAMASGRLLGDRLMGHFGIYAMLLVNGLLLAAGYFIAASFPLLLPAAAGFLLIGLGDSIMVPMIYLLAARSTKMPAAYSLSIVTLIGYAGFLTGPLFIGNVSQHLGMPVAFYCLSGVSLLIVILSRRVKKMGEAG